jgi:hypothetical protein
MQQNRKRNEGDLRSAVATVPGSTVTSHKQKLVHKRHKLQKLLGTHLSSDNMSTQIPQRLSDPALNAKIGLGGPEDGFDTPPSLAPCDSAASSQSGATKKKWWMTGKKDETGSSGEADGGTGGAETKENALDEFKKQLNPRVSEDADAAGDDLLPSPTEESVRRRAAERLAGGVGGGLKIMRKWGNSTGDTGAGKEKKRTGFFRRKHESGPEVVIEAPSPRGEEGVVE